MSGPLLHFTLLVHAGSRWTQLLVCVLWHAQLLLLQLLRWQKLYMCPQHALYMLGRHLELFAHAWMRDSPGVMSWSAKLEGGVDLGTLRGCFIDTLLHLTLTVHAGSRWTQLLVRSLWHA